MNNRILAVLAAVVMIFAFAVNAFAAEETSATAPDLSQKGSLSFTMDVGGEPLNSGSLNLYRVATVELMTGIHYDFRLLDTLAAAGATLNTDDLYNGAQAEDLLAHAQALSAQYLSQPIRDGKVHFADLEAGLYLVWQRPEDASEGYDAIAPFLISLPKWQNGAYVMDVDAKPKVPFIPETTEPPPTPPTNPPDIPQTGQLNWPVPVMGLAGAVLLILGSILCAGRKRCGREK